MPRLDHVKRSEYYKTLPGDIQKRYFKFTEKKFLHMIDNLYMSVFINGDGEDEETKYKLAPFLEELERKKEEVKETKKPVPFAHGLIVTHKAAKKGFQLNLSNIDLYDIYIRPGNLPQKTSNRIQIQLRAFGIHTRGLEAMLEDAIKTIATILADYGLTIKKVQENRIDYAYHTNMQSSINSLFTPKNQRKIKSQLTKVFHASTRKNGEEFEFNFHQFGREKANNWQITFYDKGREVVEKGYKSFFYKMWHENGLISYYDKWCFEYAFIDKNYNYIHKARLAFYLAHGTNEKRKTEYEKLLKNPNTTLHDYEKKANEFMPPVTTVINIEYKTMRKFYEKSDEFIDTRKTLERETPHPLLKRIYQIVDNRETFLNYLYSSGFSFQEGKNEKGEIIYTPFWKRLRSAKVGGIKADEKLLREYSYSIDANKIKRAGIKRVSSMSALAEREETDFVEDYLYLGETLCESDNQNHEENKLLLITDQGEKIEKMGSRLLYDYETIKIQDIRRWKNRRKNQEEKKSQRPPPEELPDEPPKKPLAIALEVYDHELPEEWRLIQGEIPQGEYIAVL